MKKSVFFIASLLCLELIQAQPTLYSENFNGPGHTFTLNSSDVGSVVSGYNLWVVNNSYTGGTFNEPCFGFPVTISNTPGQPGAITGSPNSRYLHIVSQAAQMAGVSNANFHASDGGAFCMNNQNYFAKMTNDISTVGHTNITFSCYYLCSGSSTTFGELYYSTNGGTSWHLQVGNLFQVSSWQNLIQTNTLWSNQPTLRFGFRFVNNASSTATDPSLSVDEITIVGMPSHATIATNTILQDTLCPGDPVTVDYSVSGVYNSGNVFTAELSNSSGSFSSPVVIGSVTSTTAVPINAVIPGGTAAGTGYRIRVVSSNPAVTGTDNGNNLVVGANPTADFSSSVNGLNVQFTNNSSGGTSWLWDFGDANFSSLQNPTHTYAAASTYTVCLTATSLMGCAGTICRSVTVSPSAGLDPIKSAIISVYPNPAETWMILNSEILLSGGKLDLFTPDGRLVKSFIIPKGSNAYTLMVDDLSTGLYMLRFNADDMFFHRSFIKK